MSDYLVWQSKLSLEDVFADSSSPAYPSLIGPNLLYLISLPSEKGRSVLMLKRGAHTQRVTPEGYSLRTKINEYGGKPFWLANGQLIFANQEDQCLYSQTLEFNDGLTSSEPTRLTCLPKQGVRYMYSDVHSLDDHRFICVVEEHNERLGGAENRCFIGLVDSRLADNAPTVLREGADFYCNLVFHERSRQVAWVEWNHPNMPWDENTLVRASIGNSAELTTVSELTTEPLNAAASHCQLAFNQSGLLFYSVDFTQSSQAQTMPVETSANFWNVFVVDERGVGRRVTDERLEFGYPHWQYGDHRIVSLSDDSMVAIGSAPLGDTLFLLSANGSSTPIYQADGSIQGLSANSDDELCFVECGLASKPVVIKLIREPSDSDSKDSDSKDLDSRNFARTELWSSPPYELPVSKAEAIEFVCGDGEHAYGFFYAPIDHNNAVSPPNRPPPLIVMVHGGPTARAYAHFDLQKQFWLSNGFAIFDVNPRGSTGFGRRYRDALYGEWGNLDISDVIDGINWLIQRHKVDPERICIRGKSSGGYAVLRALTEYPEVFKVGVSYYGIGNLATLAEVTHKFEKHYTDRLIGESYDVDAAQASSSEYFRRSPINKIDKISSAMLVLQGGEDMIVPPAVAHEIVEHLSKNNVLHEYCEYPEEGHGFRQLDNNMDAWRKELNFYRTVLSK